MKYFIIVISFLIITLISCAKKNDNHSEQSAKGSQTDTASLKKDKSISNFEIDSTILRTDNEGNILGGDLKDWDFDSKNYKYTLKDEFFESYSFTNNPDPRDPEQIFSEVNKNSVTLKWSTNREMECIGYDIEKIQAFEKNSVWNKVGFVKGNGNSIRTIEYKFTDKNLLDGNYQYRLKQISSNGVNEYFNLAMVVQIGNLEKAFEFYPVYPNPVIDTFNVRFYLPAKGKVSLFFVIGKDTAYIFNRMQREKGFNSVNLNKKSLGFENEIKRLYIECESCNKEKNFGDVQF